MQIKIDPETLRTVRSCKPHCEIYLDLKALQKEQYPTFGQ